MILPLALALAPSVFADIRADYQAGLRHEMQSAVAADKVQQVRKRAELSAEHVADSDSMILGIGDPEEYQPYKVECPSGNITWVRPATSGLGEGEKAYLAQRKSIIDDAVTKMMASLGMPQPARTPTIGLALSGGGYRAMINGLGQTMALMNASDEASKAGTGGWLDAVSYMAGLSGGSWATGSFLANNGTLPTDLVKNVWNLQENLIYPSDGKVALYSNMYQNVKDKREEGFPTAITDYWALALGEHLLPSAYHMDKGANYTFDRAAQTVTKFQSAELPFPIIIAAEREANETIVAENTTVWEFTPYEFGAWAVGVKNLTEGFFTPIEYLGTKLVGAETNGTCYRGFDQLSFVMGTSSTLFNYGLVELAGLNESSVITDAIQNILSSISADQNDIAQVPNPSYQYQFDSQIVNPISNLTYLTLVDAGETNQNIPLEPLLIRNIDTILAFDNSADTTYSWPNGSAIRTTWSRAVAFKEQYHLDELKIADIPTTNTFVNKGLNTRPVFFGCNVTDSPLVVYVPHYPWSYYSNSSTFKLAYNEDEAIPQMESAMRSLTLNGTVPTWPKCLACAMTDRANGYTAENRTAECQQCFNTWCWDGISDDSDPTSEYEPLAGVTPDFIVKNNLSNDVRNTPITTSTKDKKDSGAASVTVGSSVAIAALVASVLAML